MTEPRTILGIDPGLANTGWGVVRQYGPRMECVAYGCVSTPAGVELSQRLAKIHEQISAVISRFDPVCLGIETVWFGQNITAAFATGQARGAACGCNLLYHSRRVRGSRRRQRVGEA